MKKSFAIKAMILFVIFNLAEMKAVFAFEDVFTEQLARCLVLSTTYQDRIEFMKWVFLSISKHPSVKEIAHINERIYEIENKKIARIVERLITKSCRNETLNALKYEGEDAFKKAFAILGQVAARDLYTNEDVNAYLKESTKYIDLERIKQELNLE